MRHFLKSFVAALVLQSCCLTVTAQGWPSDYGGVMLQGFYWDSYVDTQWSNLESQADELAGYFDLIWVPQSGNCNSTYNVMGYTPVYWYDHNSSFGTEAQLRSFIGACRDRGVGVIADVVINHRGSIGEGGSWIDFPAETYNGVTWQLGPADICIDDDGGKTAALYDISGAKDTGEDWDGMRDLDHTSQNVQENVMAYLNFLKDDLGYAGFRYDMTKGYAPEYTGLYNSTVQPEFSVGEYWDGNVTLLINWLNGTRVKGDIQSATFDFATRYAIRDACNGNNWSKLSGKGLATNDEYKRYAVTFVDNHDTQYRSSSYVGDPVKSFVEAANAYILAMPGTPCVFLTHWKSNKEAIKQLITARKLAGVTNTSTATVLSSTTGLYAAEVSGTAGKLIIAAGTGAYTAPAGYTQVAAGGGYRLYMSGAVESPWVSVPSGTYSETFDVTLTALSQNSAATLVYTTDGTEPTANSTSVASGTAVKIDRTCTLKVALLDGGQVKGTVTRDYVVKSFEPHTATVYVKDPGWPSVYFYTWANDAGNTQLCGSWPGTEITETQTIDGVKWYCRTFDIPTQDYSFNIIFDKGSNSDQTVDIGPISEDRYYEVSETKTNGKYTVTDVTQTITGIAAPAIATATAEGPVRVYSAGGRLLRTLPAGTPAAEALNGLDKGLYIIGNSKYVK